MFMSDQDDQSRTNGHNEVGSSSNNVQDQRGGEEEEEEEPWLQLSIGNNGNARTTTTTTTTKSRGSLELHLLPGGGGSSRQFTAEFRAPPPLALSLPLPPSYCTSSLYYHHQDTNWVFRTMSQNLTLQASSSSSLMSSPGSFMNRSFQVPFGIDISGSDSEFRIVDAPRRHHTGIWFLLQASQNQ